MMLAYLGPLRRRRTPGTPRRSLAKPFGGALVGGSVYAGVQYVIKQKEGMVLNLEYAKGKGDNQGVYMKFGYGY